MGISTKKGDDGTTGLFTGERVRKDDPRIEALGVADELSVRLAHASLVAPHEKSKAYIDKLQGSLGSIMAEIAGVPSSSVGPEWIDDVIASLEADFTREGFVVPGTMEYSARLDLARVACRTFERRLVAAGFQGSILSFINRASDLLFLLARVEEKRAGTLRYR